MKKFNVYEAKTNFSKLIELVQSGEKVVIAKAGKPVADLTLHQPPKRKVKFGIWANKPGFSYKKEDFEGIDPEIQKMFYGEDRDK